MVEEEDEDDEVRERLFEWVNLADDVIGQRAFV